MALKLYHCEDCESEFRIASKIVGKSDDLTCPICGVEAVVEGPAADEDEGEEDELQEELEEEEEDPTESRRRNPRHA